MKMGAYEFTRNEFAGSLGDLGTLVPLTVSLILINQLNVSAVFLMIGVFYIACGFYYNLPMPTQPLKVVSAIAIATPLTITPAVISAAGIIFGVLLLLLAITGLIDRLAKVITKPVVRGIQLGLGFILIQKGVTFIITPLLLIQRPDSHVDLFDIPLNPVIGVAGCVVVLFLLGNKRFPASIVIITLGVIIGILAGAIQETSFTFGFDGLSLMKPSGRDFWNAAFLLVLPQIPLTLGNAVISTSDLAKTLFGDNRQTQKSSYKALSTSIGLVNIMTALIGGMPMCHGAGGLAAHYRFGARTGGSNIMIGFIFVIMALAVGSIGLVILMSIPNAVLGVLLLFAGIELCFLVKDLTDKRDLFVVFLTAGIGVSTTNMGLAFVIGVVAQRLIYWRNVSF